MGKGLEWLIFGLWRLWESLAPNSRKVTWFHVDWQWLRRSSQRSCWQQKRGVNRPVQPHVVFCYFHDFINLTVDYFWCLKTAMQGLFLSDAEER